MSLGKRIKQARENAKLTQKELADKADKGFSTIQKYEMDLVSPPLKALQKIADALEIPLNQLLDQNEDAVQNLIEMSKTFPDLSIEDRPGAYGVHLGGNLPLSKMPPEQVTYLIRSREATLDENMKPQWEIRGAVSRSALEEDGRKQDLLIHFGKLNDKGQQKAVEQVEDLAKIPDYQKGKKPPEGK